MLEKRNIRNSRYGLFETHQKGYGCFDVLHIVDLNNSCNKVIDVYPVAILLLPMIVIIPTAARKILVGNSRLVFALCGRDSALKFGEKPEARLTAMLFLACLRLCCIAMRLQHNFSMVEKESTLRLFCVFPSF